MNRGQKKGEISVWHQPSIEGLEMRTGIAVSEPYPRHWHDEYQLCLIHAGGGELRYRGSSHETPVSSLFVVHPGEVHANHTDLATGCSFRSIYVAPEIVRIAASNVIGADSERRTPLPFFPDPIILDRDIIGTYLELHRALETRRSDLEQESLFLELIAKLIERHAQHPVSISDPAGAHSAVSRARDYITDNYSSNISLAELSEVSGLSPWHLTRTFSEAVGMPPHAFQIQLRIIRAKGLLRKGWPVAQASAQTGFADQSHFTRHFKRLMLITPGQYIRNSKIVQDASGYRI